MTLSRDGAVRLRDAATGEVVWETAAGGGVGNNLAYEPAADRLVVGSSDGTVLVLDAADGTVTSRVRMPAGLVTAATVDPSGHYVLAMSADIARSRWRLWDAVTGAPLLQERDGGSSMLAMSPRFVAGGKRFVGGRADGRPELWDTARAQPLRVLPTRSASPVVRVVSDVAGRRFAGYSIDGWFYLWSAQDGALVGAWRVPRGAPAAIAMSPSGRRIAVGTSAGVVSIAEVGMDRLEATIRTHTAAAPRNQLRRLIEDAEAGGLRADAQRLLELQGEHEGGVSVVSFTGTDEMVLAGGVDGSVVVANVDSGTITGRLRGHRLAVRRLQVAGDRALTWSDDGRALVWSLGNSQELALRPAGSTRSKFLPAVAADAASPRALVVAAGDTAVWDLAGTPRRVRDLGATPVGLVGTDLFMEWGSDGLSVTNAAGTATRGLDGSAGLAAFPPYAADAAGDRVAAVSIDGEVWVWNARTGGLLWSKRVADLSGGHQLRFADDGSLTVSLGLGTPLLSLDAASGAERVRFPSAAPDSQVFIAPDGRHALQFSAEDLAGPALLDLGQPGAAARLESSFAPGVTTADFAPDSSMVVTSGGGPARLWSVRDGAPVRSFGPTLPDATSARFMAGGDFLVTTHEDGYVRVWDTATAGQLAEYHPPAGRAADAVPVGSDGAVLVVGTTGRVWAPRCDAAAPDNGLIAAARRHVPFGQLGAWP